MKRHEIRATSWRQAARVALAHIGFWALLCAIGAAGNHVDKIGRGESQDYATVFLHWCADHVPVALLSTALGMALLRRPALFTERRITAFTAAALLLLYAPAEWYYVACADLVQRGLPFSWQAGWQEFTGMRRLVFFTETAWISGTFIAMVAIGNWREARRREQAWKLAREENLSLQLALEEQRMLALRAQLEPHFIFNALNAISALVRANSKADAVGGIARLSDLLRYALTATQQETASLADELGFVRDYLALQRLRYGERLQVTIEGAHELDAMRGCPPLILQPLIENALRHSLDSHEGPSDIRLSFERTADQMLIRVSNPVHAEASPNPGTGLGLRNTRARLKLGSAGAALHTQVRDGRFVAEVRLPLLREEALA